MGSWRGEPGRLTDTQPKPGAARVT